MAKRTLVTLICDNPDCDVEREVVKGARPFGYFITNVFWAHKDANGNMSDVYACSTDCLAPAVVWRSKEKHG